MQVIKCFEVLGHTDHGPMKVIRFSTREEAEKYFRFGVVPTLVGVLGNRSKDDVEYIKEVTLTILDSAEELTLANQEELKAKALAKLTKAEREALGL